MTSPQLPSQPITSPYAIVANAANGATSGLSEFSSWTKDDWDAFLSGKWVPHFDGIGGPLAAAWEWINAITSAFQGDFGPLEDLLGEVIEGFVSGFADLRAAFEGTYTGSDPVLSAIQTFISGKWTGLGNAQTMLQQIADILNGLIVTPINSAVQGVKDWFASLVGWQSSTSSLLSSTTARLDDVEEAITRLEDVAIFAPVTPSYVSDVQDMASCSRNACKTISINSAGSMSCSDSVHSHPAHSHSATWVPATYSPERYANISGIYQSPVDYVPIVVDRKGVVDKLRWKTGADDSIFGIDAYYMALCVYNKTTGAIEKVWDSGNIKDTTANVSGSSREVELAMDIDQECTPGQLLFVAHQQIAPGAFQSTRSIGCEPLSGDGRPSSLAPLDGAMLRTPGRYGSIPSTIQASTLTRLNTQQLWAAVSVDTSGGS